MNNIKQAVVDTLKQTTVPTASRKTIDRLLAQKKQTSELGRGPRIPTIDKFIDSCFETAREFCVEAPEHTIPTDAANKLFLSVLHETWEKH